MPGLEPLVLSTGQARVSSQIVPWRRWEDVLAGKDFIWGWDVKKRAKHIPSVTSRNVHYEKSAAPVAKVSQNGFEVAMIGSFERFAIPSQDAIDPQANLLSPALDRVWIFCEKSFGRGKPRLDVAHRQDEAGSRI
jgi:hypothetical protein